MELSREPDKSDPNPMTEGCAVDWSWLVGRQIATARSDLESFILTFADGQTLTIRAGLFDQAPFLSFRPWQSPSAPAPQLPAGRDSLGPIEDEDGAGGDRS